MNYNSLMNKPTINYRELIGDNTVTEVGGITEEQFNTLLSTDLSSYYTKAQIDDLFSRSYVYREKSGSIVTFDCPASVNCIDKVVSEIVAVQSGTGDPSPTNVRPISGWSAVNVHDNDINIWNEQMELGSFGPQGEETVANDNLRTADYIDVGAFRGMSLYIKHPSNNAGIFRVYLYGHDKSFLSYLDGNNVGVFNVPENCFYIRFRTYAVYGTTYKHDISVNYPSSDREYHAYNGTTYTTALKDGQGNPMVCYGGTLSNENGVQSLTNACTIIDMGTINWVYSNGVFGSNQVSPALLTNGKLMCSQYKWNSTPNIAPSRLADGEISASPYFNTGTVMVKDSRYSDATAFKTAISGVMLVYELKTPQQIPQDNLAIATQEGVNNLWADSGDITVNALDKIIQG